MRESKRHSDPWRPGEERSFHAGAVTGETWTRADLHTHTCASNGSATRWLGTLGVAESYSEPEEVYDLARARGMDLVAITDHDTIDSAMRLRERGFDRLIVGEEITTRFADTGCALHVLAWGLTPDLHQEISSFGLREDAAALAHWLRDRRLTHAMAHPLFDINRRLTIAELRRCLTLFGGFEAINAGHTTARHRLAFERLFLRSAPAPSNLQPAMWETPWLTGGSDDHALHNVGRAWTAVRGMVDPTQFLEAIQLGESVPGGADATTDSLAMQFVGVARRFAASDSQKKPSRRIQRIRRTLIALLPNESASDDASSEPSAGVMQAAALRAAIDLAGAAPRWMNGDAMRIRSILDAAAPVLVPQAAHVAAFMQHQRERRLIDRIERGATPIPPRRLRLALFVDSLDHTSGVSRFVLDLARQADEQARDLAVFTCADHADDWPRSVRSFKPIGRMSLPMYQGLKLAVPWAPDLLESCAQWRPDIIHVSTPGPVGLTGLIGAKALDVPLAGTHHTDFPAYASRLTGSRRAEPLTTQALKELYSRFDRVLVRSTEYAERVSALNVPDARIRVITPGIDQSRFGAARRDQAIWTQFPGAQRSSVKALYVGRLSREKNLDLLGTVWREAHARLEQLGVASELIVVGDGPFRAEWSKQLVGRRARFLGAQSGDQLAAIYASCDLFLFPSVTDTLGQVVIEAQASGLPAIVTDRGGPKSLIAHDHTGFIISADAVDDWIRATVLLAADGDRRRRMSRAAAAHAKQFTFERTFRSFWASHEELLAESMTTDTSTPSPVVVTGAAFRNPVATAST